MQSLAVFFLVAVAIGGVAWVFLYPMLSGERRRSAARTRSPRPARCRGPRAAQRAKDAARAGRGHAQGSRGAAGQEIRAAAPEDPAGGTELVEPAVHSDQRCARPRSFLLFLMIDAGLFAALAIGFRGRLWHAGLAAQISQEAARDQIPRSVPGRGRHHRARHQGRPAAARQHADHRHSKSPEPLRSEFHAIMETQAIGIPIGDAFGKLFERIPVPEANFFGIVIAIQSEVRRQPVGGARQPFARACATARR